MLKKFSRFFIVLVFFTNLLWADTLINAVVWEKQTLTVVANAPLVASFNITTDGYRLILPGGVLNIAHPAKLTPINDLFDSIEYDQKSLSPATAEIILKTRKKLQHTIYIEDNGRNFILKFSDFTAPPPPPVPPGMRVKLTSVEWVTENNNLKFRFLTDGGAHDNFKVHRFTNPERLVLDLAPPVALGIANEIPVNLGPVERLRASQFTWEPLQTRIVLDLNSAYDNYIYSPGSPYPLTILAKSNGISTTTAPTPAPPPSVSPLKDVRVAIIAGHGGSDPGAISPQGLKEKDITLEIAKLLQTALRAKGAVTLLNREGDEGSSMDEQAQFANRNKADLLVSIHLNSFINSATNGAESFYYKPIDKELAECVHEEIIKATGQHDRGLRKSQLHNLNHTEMPGVLIEPLFMSNPREEKLMRSPEFRQKLIDGIIKGLERYQEKKKTST